MSPAKKKGAKKSVGRAAKKSPPAVAPTTAPEPYRPLACKGFRKPGAMEEITRLLAAGDLEQARIVSRNGWEGCGEDLRPIIESFPFDGQQYNYECPRCGKEHHTTRTPIITEPEEPAE